MKKLFNIFALSLIFVFSMATFIGCNPKPSNPESPNTTSTLYEMSQDGKYIYFGMYPQSIKDESVIVSQSPDQDGYYIGSDGAKYVKQTFNIDCEQIEMTEDDLYFMNFSDVSNDTTMIIEESYYFKLEKLKWRILKKQNGKALIVCDTIIRGLTYQPNYIEDNGEFYVSDGTGGILTEQDGSKVYANNYQYSELRRFLTEDFYNQAFTTEQKTLINLTNIDNSSVTTNNNSNIYAGNNTQDYIFTLSFADMKNADYGFKTSMSERDVNRNWYVSDFAKSTCAYNFTHNYIVYGKNVVEDSDIYKELLPYINTGVVWLRSPASYRSKTVLNICLGAEGTGSIYDFVNGVVPALNITL